MAIPKINFPIYGIIILLSLIIGGCYILYNLKEKIKENNNILFFFLFFFIFPILFGKMYTYILSMGKIPLLEAGLSSYGGLLGIMFGAFVFEKILPYNNEIIKYSIISLTLIYSISKIGCFIAGCCYGIPYNGLFAVTYPSIPETSLFPIQIVETISFFILFLVCNHFKKNKYILYIVVITASTLKLLLDFLRYEHIDKMISSNQIFSIILIVITIILFIYNYKKNKTSNN